MKVLDLFSGIGGFSLGLERAGMKTVAFCEIDPYCRAVLRKHWPDAPCYDDIRSLTAERLAADGIAVDLICGGFPCQDISCAGAGAGIGGERSGLWREYARLIGELRPCFVIVENVAALLGRGLGVVLGDLAALGFDAEWHCIPASAVGAPHRRDRVWIVAYPDSRGAHSEPQRLGECGRAAYAGGHGQIRPMADAAKVGSDGAREARTPGPRSPGGRGGQRDLRHAHGPRLAIWKGIRRDDGEEQQAAFRTDWWLSEPDVGRVAHGVPSRVDRLGALGNAVVPQIPEIIGRAIMESRP